MESALKLCFPRGIARVDDVMYKVGAVFRVIALPNLSFRQENKLRYFLNVQEAGIFSKFGFPYSEHIFDVDVYVMQIQICCCKPKNPCRLSTVQDLYIAFAFIYFFSFVIGKSFLYFKQSFEKS
jgi:hypothetical protein